MSERVPRAVAIVGVGAVLPDAPDAQTFWANVREGRYSISDVTPERWDPALYHDPDPKAVDKTYSKIGGWVRTWDWDPLAWRLPIPPRVADAMDRTQIWAIVAARQALLDYGWPAKSLDGERTAVILGNAMAGDRHYMTAMRIFLPEFTRDLSAAPSFAALPPEAQQAVLDEFRDRVHERIPDITEDTMPGELANINAGRIANLFDFHGPNFVTDAACASALAGINAAIEGLEHGDYDAVLTGGVDANMSASSFVKFCKIGALSATGTRPYGEGADGFVMGEGAALFLLKRLEDAERAGDRVYAVIRGIGGSSDGRGKGITAPNPVGQRLAVERAWRNAGCAPDAASLIEGHGTSTRVGDVVEVESIGEVFSKLGLPPGSIPLGSVKSNIGHLKAAAGAAGLLKAVMAIHEELVPPSLNAERPNPSIDFTGSPLYVNTELKEWKASPGQLRRAGVSAFGFGGTNFHVVLEEYVPGRIRTGDTTATYSFAGSGPTVGSAEPKQPLRGAVVVGGESFEAIGARLHAIAEAARAGEAPPVEAPAGSDLDAPHRIAIDYGNAAELAAKIDKVEAALSSGQEAAWQLLTNQGVHRGSGPAGQVAFLYTGQGSQYVNMLDALRGVEPHVAETFAEADEVMTPILGRPLSSYIFVEDADPDLVAAAEADLMRTEITQPAVLATDIALTRLLKAYGVAPDMVMGHSLGEYGALVAAESLPFGQALEAVAGRGREMARVSLDDNGLMAAVFAPLPDVEAAVAAVGGYVVVANVNSTSQAVIGGSTAGVREAMALLEKAGHQVVQLPVSHAFHTEIVAPASGPLRELLARMDLRSPAIPLVANVSGDFYPRGPQVEAEMIDILGRQIACPVQFVAGLETLYGAGARVFVEVGPKKALHGFAEDVLGDRGDVVALFANHPKQGDVVSFNQALCGLYAAGLGAARRSPTPATMPPAAPTPQKESSMAMTAAPTTSAMAPPAPGVTETGYRELGHLFADFLDRAYEVYRGRPEPATEPADDRPVAVTGAGIGLPGMERVFEEGALGRLLHGEQFIDAIPVRTRQHIVDHHITRLVKSEAGGGHFETIDTQSDVIKLAGRGGTLDLVEEFGFPEERAVALDRTAELAIAAGIDALRDAGIPLVMRYKTATTGARLPERWMLPEAMRDDTGVIFASAFPGLETVIDEVTRFEEDRAGHAHLDDLKQLRTRADGGVIAEDLDHRIRELEAHLEANRYVFDRRFLYKGLAFAHAQFAEYIGARGPNTQLNAACASTTQAVAIAEDWIRQGRCARVVIISADDVTTDRVLGLVGSGFLAVGAAATDDVVEEAAVPFDRRRHGMILGMGAAALVVESAESAAARGLQPIVEVLSSITANSAFHGSRLDTTHISQVMEQVVSSAERRWGVDRAAIAAETVFVSHETYTPARGGSAQAEIDALRHVFGEAADRVVITNTKGFTGHAMATGIEDVLAVKAMETGIVPQVPNFKEVDPDLGALNLSTGGSYPIRYGLRLGAGFGSQISMTLYRSLPSPLGRHPDIGELGFAYRIVDRDRWSSWLSTAAGHDHPEVEVVKRTLRVADHVMEGAPATVPVAEPAQVAAVEPSAVEEEPVTEPVPVAVVGEHDVAARVLEIVAAETGYPPDMLDLDLDLEADLGIDTVKQAEMFATIRAEWDIERDDRLALRDYPTLKHVIEFVHERRPAPTTPTTTPTPPPPAVPVAVVGEHDVAARVLEIVAAETGYPPDMLDLDLDLEADLGIDTVKQAEMFATIRAEWDIERDDRLALRDYPTLKHVIEFVHERRPAPTPTTTPTPPPAAVQVAVVGEHDVAARVLEIVAAETGYPPDMLDLDLDLEADLGIDTVKQAEMFATIRAEWDIERDDRLALRDYPTLKHVIEFVHERRPAPTTPTTTPTPPPPAVQVAVVGEHDVAARVLEIVAAETGYPPDMLDLDLDLEADLGIDTVKQAEMFATIRAEWDIERDDRLALRDYPTLKHVIEFVHERRPAPTTPTTTPTPPPAAVQVADDEEPVQAVPRRVPIPVLRPPLDHCLPTGVTLDEGSRVIVFTDQGGVGRSLVERLAGRGVAVHSIDDAPDADDLVQRIGAWAGDGPVTGVYWLAALDREGEDLDLEGWREALRTRVKLLYTTMRHLSDRVGDAGTFLVTATRLGGRHGYDGGAPPAPLGGAVSGFTKTYKREKPEALVKVVDFPVSRKTAALADALIDETLADPGAVEVGCSDDGRRWTVTLGEQPLPPEPSGLDLGPDSVFVVTGAAGSIVSAITADLAKAFGGTFHLLDLVPEPVSDDPDIALFREDRDALQRKIYDWLKESGERATPAVVEKQIARVERASAALAAIEAIEAAGGTAHYHSVDLRDGKAMAGVTAAISELHDRVDVVLHAGGLEVSRLLADKEPAEYDLVFDVKADGWFNLIAGLADTPIGATVAFSSIAGRFGNAGQADYAAANDLLCKASLAMGSTMPGTTGIAIDWTAWGDIGMATRGSIPTVMKAAGIDMLPAALGVPIVRRELIGAAGSREVVVANGLGAFLAEWHPTGGVDVAAFSSEDRPSVMVGTVESFGIHEGMRVTTILDPAEQGFLDDHRIDGTPVLPGVMGVEAFAEAALLPFPDLVVAAVENVDFMVPFKFYRSEPRELTITVRYGQEGDEIVADCALLGARDLVTAEGPQITKHFTGLVRLAADRREITGASPPPDSHNGVDGDDVYRIYFHGPAYQVVGHAWRVDDTMAAAFAEDLPANHHPAGTPTATEPRLLELCFQTAGLWEIGTTGTMALPRHIDRVLLGDRREPEAGPLWVIVRPGEGSFDAIVVDDAANGVLEMRGYHTIETPAPLDSDRVGPVRLAVLGHG